MSSQRCSSCGAPLPDNGGACTFCGLVPGDHHAGDHHAGDRHAGDRATLSVEREKVTFSIPSSQIRPSPAPTLSPEASRKVGAAIGKTIGCLLLLAIGFGIFIACGVASCVGSIIGSVADAPSSSSASRSSPAPSRARARAGAGAAGASAGVLPSELRMAPSGTYVLRVSGPLGGYHDWDPIERIEWASALAKVWSSEATLQRIDVQHADSRGYLNLSSAASTRAGQPEVIYRFWPSVAPTPERVEELEKSAREASDAKRATDGTIASGTELWIRVSQGVPAAVISRLTPADGAKPPNVWDDDQPDVDSERLHDIFATLATRRGFNAETTYSGSLQYDSRDGWVWTLKQASGAALPRIRARDGRLLSRAR